MEKKTNKLSNIPGTKLALKNTQLLISTGISSLDDLIGGGIPVGTIFLIQEDSTGLYSKVMLRYFLAEGIVNEHSLHIVSQTSEPQSFIKNLPDVIQTEDNLPNLNKEDDKLVIAWRYKNMKTEAKGRTTFSHNYDLTKVMKDSLIEKSVISYWSSKKNYEDGFGFKNSAYADVLRNIRQIIEENGYSLTAHPVKGNILRIVIHSVGCPLWLSNTNNDNNDLNMFFYYLRSLARSAFIVIAVSVPTSLINTETLNNITHSSDIAIQLDSFAGTLLEKNIALADYQGFFKFKKFHSINCLKNSDPGPTDFVFKMRRKKFLIEMLHLPPDIQESNEQPRTGCGGSSKLEF